jgi:DNA repair protein RadA/Sms
MMLRDSTGLAPLDHVLGGGLVRGAVVLCAARPNSGSTTLALQLLDGLHRRCLYTTGDETHAEVTSKARRLGVAVDRVSLAVERDLSEILKRARAMQAQAIVIDPIQRLYYAGTLAWGSSLLTKCLEQLVAYAKEHDTSIWLVGRITRAGDVAGPKTIEHHVDVALKLELGSSDERILNCASKNRFATSDRVGRFKLTEEGLRAV